MNNIDSGLPPELIASYLQRRQADLKACQEALSKKDWHFFETLGHQIKGNAQSYGFYSLGVWAQEVEQAAKEHSIETLEVKVQEFHEWLKPKVM